MILAVNYFYKKERIVNLKDDMLGKKIKNLRLERKMTQSELAGETITRNMLSQIENGVAQPSVSTIVDLAKKLGTPVEYFFSENGDLDDFKKLAAIAKIKKYYASKDYVKCISRLDALGVSDDETEFLYAKSYFARGMAAYREGMLKSAVTFLKAAIEHSERSVYPEDELSSLARQYLNVITFIGTKNSDLFLAESFGDRCDRYREDILYIRAIAGGPYPFSDKEKTLYSEHLALRKDFDFEDVERITVSLEALKTLLARCGEEDAVLKYYIYCDLEKLASSCGDYKCAYECSSERLLLADKMNH